jgi:hypothetical protein
MVSGKDVTEFIAWATASKVDPEDALARLPELL